MNEVLMCLHRDLQWQQFVTRCKRTGHKTQW